MTAAFADTAYFLALLNPSDQFHPKARDLSRTDSRPLVTTEFVLIEVGDGLSRPANRSLFAKLRELLAAQPDVEVIPASSNLCMATYCSRGFWHLKESLTMRLPRVVVEVHDL